jgi:hypothetical protein
MVLQQKQQQQPQQLKLRFQPKICDLRHQVFSRFIISGQQTNCWFALLLMWLKNLKA